MSVHDHSAEREAYLDLVRGGGHGAVAATRGAVPIIFPVTFELSGDRLTFEVSSPDAADPQLDGSVVAFDTACVDGESGLLWHVHVLGVALEIGPARSGRPSRFALSTDMISGWIGDV